MSIIRRCTGYTVKKGLSEEEASEAKGIGSMPGDETPCLQYRPDVVHGLRV
jgi:hypothetical protein